MGLTDKDLEGLLRRATPAPWRCEGRGYTIRADDAPYGEVTTNTDGEAGFCRDEDVALVVAIRNAAESLIAEIREARKLLREAREVLEAWHRTARGHHPEESCCDVTEAIEMLSG